MTVSVLITSNLTERRDWLVHRLLFLEHAGHTGEVLVGVWGGHDQISYVESVCRSAINKCRVSIVAQDGELFMLERLEELARQSTYDFIAVQGDDDFLIPTAFTRSVETLRDNTDILCAQGRCLRVQLDAGFPEKFAPSPFPLWQALEEDAVDRFCNLMKHYSFTWHAIYRKHQFIERLQYMADVHKHADDFVFFEGMGDLYSVIKGKVVILDELFIVRGDHSQSGAKTLRKGISYQMPPYLLLSPTFSRSYKHFESSALKIFRSMGVDTSDEDILKRILDGMINFMGRLFFKIRDGLDKDEIHFQKNLTGSTRSTIEIVHRQIYVSYLRSELEKARAVMQ